METPRGRPGDAAPGRGRGRGPRGRSVNALFPSPLGRRCCLAFQAAGCDQPGRTFLIQLNLPPSLKPPHQAATGCHQIGSNWMTASGSPPRGAGDEARKITLCPEKCGGKNDFARRKMGRDCFIGEFWQKKNNLKLGKFNFSFVIGKFWKFTIL